MCYDKVENDVSFAASAERGFGHGRGVGTFCFVCIAGPGPNASSV